MKDLLHNNFSAAISTFWLRLHQNVFNIYYGICFKIFASPRSKSENFAMKIITQ